MFVEKEFYVGLNDIMTGKKLSNKAILKYLEDIAGIHSNMVGYGLNDIESVEHTWMLLAWKVQLHKRPIYSETITIKTWSRPMKNFYAFRDFQIFNENKELIGIASSKWVFINIVKEGIERIPQEVADLYQNETDHVFPDDDFGKLFETPNVDSCSDYKITRSMIDINNHVHNIHYLDIADEALPDSLYEKEFNKFEIMYKKEIKREPYGTIVNCTCTNSPETNIIAVKSLDGKLLHAIIKLSE